VGSSREVVAVKGVNNSVGYRGSTCQYSNRGGKSQCGS
jgi:hypothetical protein